MNKFLIFLFTAIFMIPAYAQTIHIIKLNKDNTVNFRGEVSGESITIAQLKLAELVSKRGKAKYPIYLVLDSPGGSIIAGLAFIAFAKHLENVQTVSIFAASMASAIAEAMPGKRNITTDGVMMFHRARGQFNGQFEDGELEKELELFKSIVRSMEVVNADRMKLSLLDYKAKVKDEYWLYGKDAVSKNAADEVVELTCDMALIRSREVLFVEGMFGEMKVNFSGCPLFRAPLP